LSIRVASKKKTGLSDSLEREFSLIKAPVNKSTLQVDLLSHYRFIVVLTKKKCALPKHYFLDLNPAATTVGSAERISYERNRNLVKYE
jgi:hypothetical protein